MTSLFVICLAVGALLSVAMALLGATHGPSSPAHHIGSHQIGAHHGTGGASSGGLIGHVLVWSLSWLSPLTLGGFLLLFGGAGLLAGGGALGVIIAVICGLLGAFAVRSLLGAFTRASSPGISSTAEGAIGHIVSTIAAGGSGEVSYRLEGLERTVICVAENRALRIPRGTTVVITRREGGYAYVEPLDALDQAES
jgi:membrane protein implicated in regulation of membrane protease activity